MSALITSIVELSQKFFDSPIEYNKYFAITNDYQKHCYNNTLLTRCSVGVIAKEAMLIHDIFFNLIAGSIKLLAGGIKGLCAIPAGAFNVETDHQKYVKESVVHFGFSAFYTADVIISLLNINDSYPRDLLKKVESIFAEFLDTPSKKEVIVEYIPDPESEERARELQKEVEIKDLTLQLEQQKAKEKAEKMQAEMEARTLAFQLEQQSAEKKALELQREVEEKALAFQLEKKRADSLENEAYLLEEEIEGICTLQHEELKEQAFTEKPMLQEDLTIENSVLHRLINKPCQIPRLTYDDLSEDEDEFYEDDYCPIEKSSLSNKRQELIDKDISDASALSLPCKNKEEDLQSKNCAGKKTENIQISITDGAEELVPISNPLNQIKINSTQLVEKQSHTASKKSKSATSSKKPLSAQEKRQRVKEYEQSRREKAQKNKKITYKAGAL